MKSNIWVIILSILFIITAIFNAEPNYSLMLTAAQMVFVPIMLIKIVGRSNLLAYIIGISMISVMFLQITDETNWDPILAGVYLIYTLITAFVGFERFLKRGFTHLEEFLIDAAMMFLAIGGMWFFASVTKIETGFSPIITWLTAIHFHYASFLLPVFTGFIGRLYKPSYYRIVSSLILIAPILTALGITLSVWLELLSILPYIVAICGLIVLMLKAKFPNTLQAILVRTSLGALGITITFSLLYAVSNSFGGLSISIPFMLVFHGILNCILFGLLGVVGWSLAIPQVRERANFPISRIRGNTVVGEKAIESFVDDSKSYSGLVDDMDVYGLDSIPRTIRDFYENTDQYRLYSEVEWHPWFKPFAFIYTRISKRIRQLNLPFSHERMEMTGSIRGIVAMDGREKPRAWTRKIGEEEVFIALYSQHISNDQVYMNIALPLPRSSMIGILMLKMEGDELILTSESTEGDAGIYLAVGRYLPKLPISERFNVKEEGAGVLTAKHDMKICSLPFLTIRYEILHTSVGSVKSRKEHIGAIDK